MGHRSNKQTPQGAETPDSLPWRVTGNHVYPAHDLREHSLKDCWCNPTEDEGVLVHHSLDGRELYERGERQLS
jgi:hypothetical protein